MVIDTREAQVLEGKRAQLVGELPFGIRRRELLPMDAVEQISQAKGVHSCQGSQGVVGFVWAGLNSIIT